MYGFVAGRNGLSWAMTRAGCEAYQVNMTFKGTRQIRLVRECLAPIKTWEYLLFNDPPKEGDSTSYL